MALHKDYNVWFKVDGRLNLATQERINIKTKYDLDAPDRMPDMVVQADNLREARKKAEKGLLKGIVIWEIKNAWWYSGEDFYKHHPIWRR